MAYNIPQSPKTIKRDRSYDHRNIGRIKSAHPLNIDREKLAQENINLKTQLNKMENEKINHKREIANLENELMQREKFIENMMSESQSNSNTFAKASEMGLVINVKRQYKELKKEYEKNIQLLEQIKKDIKFTKINDLLSENKTLTSQIEKFKHLYDQSENQNINMQKNIQNVDVMKQALSKQDMMLSSFQENCQKMEIEIQILNEEIDKLENLKSKKEDTYNRLKKKLKLQQQIHEKLVMIRDNIQNTEVFLIMKNQYETKIQNFRKDLAYYRDSNAKNEKLVKEIAKFNKKEEDLDTSEKNERKIVSSNPQPSLGGESEEEANKKILLLQNLIMDEKNEKEKLKKTIEELTQKIENSKLVEPKIILTKSYSANNIKKQVDNIEYEYFSDAKLKDFIYIILKNLEANEIDMSILELRVFNDETLTLLKDESNYNDFITHVGNNLCEVLKVKQEKDEFEVHSFIKTCLYNNYILSEKKNPDDFKAKVLSLFTNINFYSIEQREELNKVIALKFCKNKEKFLELLNYFDEKENGYLNFSAINKIVQQLKIKFKPDVKEYFIYVMKCFQDEDSFLKDLKYGNILKILEETPVNMDEYVEEENAPEVDEAKDNKNKNNNDDKNNDNDDDAIEITNEEYLSKVKDIISRICDVLLKTKKPIDEYFLKIVSNSITDYRAIRLIKLVDVLKQDFNIELSNIEIFCLFTKIKPNLNSSKNTDDIEEIVDYDKLKTEIEEFLRNPPAKKPAPVSNSKLNTSKKKDKLDYEDILEHAPMEKIDKSSEENNVRKILNDFMRKHQFSFERFVFPVHCMMKLATDGKIFNRYLDFEFFKHFLYQNGIDIQSFDLIEFIDDNKMLYNNEKINIDYLKFILENGKNAKDKMKAGQFILFKPLKMDRPEAAKIKKNKEKETKKDDFPFDESDSESVKMIQKEINGES